MDEESYYLQSKHQFRHQSIRSRPHKVHKLVALLPENQEDKLIVGSHQIHHSLLDNPQVDELDSPLFEDSPYQARFPEI